ncbi:3-deoxy-D-manno-octulosonic-acid transferase [Burkholderiales bacterium]|nr:3-deoxy-D-manno-octulosonic-acid transferase [Burkholderiales bacterium]
MTPNPGAGTPAAGSPANPQSHARPKRTANNGGDSRGRAKARVNDVVDAVLVVSVRSFQDRIAHMRAEMARFGIEFEWIFDFDPDSITPELLERTFAPSDMRLPHQSAVLKHIATWRICAERKYRRVLVFEDDVVLASNFPEVLAQAMSEADALRTPYLVYLGCGHNRYAAGASDSPTMLVAGGSLPAAEAIVIDHESAVMRMAWLEKHKVTRPPDWLLREVDVELGIPHYWLREPVVEQGSMNGKFASVLDEKRRGRGRLYAWLRFRWDRWRHRAVGGRTVPTDRN